MSQRITLQKIEIQRAYGKRFDNLSLSNLSPNVNIVHGPNASGKTTLSRGIQTLLLPSHLKSATLSGTLTLGHYELEIIVVGKRVKYLLNGTKTDWRPKLIRPKSYHIALHELLSADSTGESYAQEIVRQASGGYDLDKAASSLGFDKIPRLYTSTSTKKVLRDHRDLHEIRGLHERLYRDRSKLQQLESKLEAATEAEKKIRILRCGLDYHKSRSAWQPLKNDVDQYDPILHQSLHTDLSKVPAQIGDATRKLTALGNSLLRRQKELDECEQAIGDSFLPRSGLPNGLLQQLSSEIQSLKDAEDTVTRMNDSLAGLQQEAASFLGDISEAVSPEKSQRISFADFRRVGKALQQSDNVRSRHSALEELHELLKTESATDLEEHSSRIKEGMRLLVLWLRQGVLRLLPIKISLWCGIALIPSIALATQNWYTLILLLPIGLAIVWIHTLSGGSSLRSSLQQRFSQLGIGEPSDWTEAEVETRLEKLAKEQSSAELALLKRSHWAAKTLEHSQLSEKKASIDEEFEYLTKKTGIPVSNESSLYYLTSQVLRYQQKKFEVEGAKARRTNAINERDECLARVNRTLSPYQSGSVSDSNGAIGARELLSAENQKLSQLNTLHHSLQQNIGHDQKQYNELVIIRRDLYHQFGVDEGDSAKLFQKLEDAEALKGQIKKEEQARAVMDAEERKLRAIALDADDLINMRPEEIDRLLDHQTDIAAGRDSIQKEITTIRTRLKDNESKNALESALATLEDSKSTLESQREAHLAKVIGCVLVKTLKKHTRERDLPEVFNKAKEKFLNVTAGRYELLLGDQGTFRAKDYQLKRSLNLDELSSGTRVQLLLCVRMAFVETQESDYHFPITLDETLGNSDDERVPEIIRTIVRLAHQRQVIYFTAQGDEVRKWSDIVPSEQLKIHSLHRNFKLIS